MIKLILKYANTQLQHNHIIMTNVLVFDVETTGLIRKDEPFPYVIQLCFKKMLYVRLGPENKHIKFISQTTKIAKLV